LLLTSKIPIAVFGKRLELNSQSCCVVLLHTEAPNKRKIEEKAMCEWESVCNAWAVFPSILGDNRNIDKTKKVFVTY